MNVAIVHLDDCKSHVQQQLSTGLRLVFPCRQYLLIAKQRRPCVHSFHLTFILVDVLPKQSVVDDCQFTHIHSVL